ncbi:hypothetical protein SprV_0301316200 [Sparganum proliferum]
MMEKRKFPKRQFEYNMAHEFALSSSSSSSGDDERDTMSGPRIFTHIDVFMGAQPSAQHEDGRPSRSGSPPPTSSQIVAHSTGSGHAFKFTEVVILARDDNRVSRELPESGFTDPCSICKRNGLHMLC